MSLLQSVALYEGPLDGAPKPPTSDKGPKANLGMQDHEHKLMKSMGLGKDQFNSLTDKKAQDLIAGAHEEAEEIETVCFGLETDDGEIVKVYVNAEEGDAFEKALSDLLGEVDDIEEAINKLADDFDIVSVEWPEDMQHDNQAPDETQLPQGDQDNPEETSDEDEHEGFDLGFDLTAKQPKEGDEEEEEEEEDKDKKKGKDEDEEEESEEKPEGEKKKEDDDFNFGDLGDLGGDEEEEEGKDKKKKKGKKKDEKKDEKKDKKKADNPFAENFLFSTFLGEPLLEKRAELSADEVKIEDIFHSAFQQKIVTLLFLLDFPVDKMLSRKSLLRKSIRARAAELSNDTKAKSLISKLTRDLTSLTTRDETYEKHRKLVGNFSKEDLKESDIEEKATNETQKLLIQIYKGLGVPDALMNTKISQLKQDIRKTARILASHTKIKTNLHKLAAILSKETVKESQLLKEVEVGDDEEKSEGYSPDKFVNLIIAIVEQLGIPKDNLEYRKPDIIKSIREAKTKTNNGQVRGRLVALYKILSGEQITNEDMTLAEMSHADENRALDMGEWNIAKLGSEGLILSVEDVDIRIKEHSLETFRAAIENGMSTTIKDGNDEWEFKALHHGKVYIAINNKSDIYGHGIRISEKSVDNILDYLNDL